MIKRRVILSLALVLLALLTLTTHLNERAMQIHNDSFERAVGSFAIAKGLNAVISLIQGTEINASPAGVGVTLTIGEILDPMNDLIERFSWVMLAASVSLGIQKLLLSLGSVMFVQVSLVAMLAFLLAILWYKPLQHRFTVTIALRLALVLLLLRFGALFFIHAESQLYTALMEQEYNAATQALTETRIQLESIATQSDQHIAKEQSFMDSLSHSYDKAKEMLDIRQQLESLQSHFEDAQKQVINLITIFVVLTVLLPLLFLWIIFGLFKWAFSGRFDTTHLREWLFGYSR